MRAAFQYKLKRRPFFRPLPQATAQPRSDQANFLILPIYANPSTLFAELRSSFLMAKWLF
jgi:hypothetical protein